jgi:acetyl esterase/lipase
MNSLVRVASSLAALTILCFAQQPAERTIPARTIPVPSTVSPELQKVIAPAWSGSKSPMTLTSDEWKALQKRTDEGRAKTLQPVKQKFHVSVQEEKIAGVRVYRVKPQAIATENRNRLLVHVHGGAYVFGGGESAASEAVLMANFGKIEVVSVDYRMPPDFPFPAALDDALAVWKEIAGSRDAKNLGLFGTSTGGGLTLAMVLKLKELKMPLPGAIMAGTPWSDMTKTGDTFYTNELVDNVLGSNDGLLEAAAKLYAGKHDLKEPLLSPVYGDLTDFPPAILLSGTRDLFLSNTVRVHQKLLQAGSMAELLVFEGQSHAQYTFAPDAPETAAAWNEVGKFFDRHLNR